MKKIFKFSFYLISLLSIMQMSYASFSVKCNPMNTNRFKVGTSLVENYNIKGIAKQLMNEHINGENKITLEKYYFNRDTKLATRASQPKSLGDYIIIIAELSFTDISNDNDTDKIEDLKVDFSLVPDPRLKIRSTYLVVSCFAKSVYHKK